MSMNGVASRGSQCEINVTPLIDVPLVLLIIFMVIVPAIPKGESALVPKASHGESGNSPVVLEVLKDAAGEVAFRINQEDVGRGALGGRLETIYANRAQRLLFVKGDDQLKFLQIAEAIDIGRAAGVDRVALLTPKVAAGL